MFKFRNIYVFWIFILGVIDGNSIFFFSVTWLLYLGIGEKGQLKPEEFFLWCWKIQGYLPYDKVKDAGNVQCTFSPPAEVHFLKLNLDFVYIWGITYFIVTLIWFLPF